MSTQYGALAHTGVGIKRADKYVQNASEVLPAVTQEPAASTPVPEETVVKTQFRTVCGGLPPIGVGNKYRASGGGEVKVVIS